MHPDQLRAARGCCLAVALSCLFWALLFIAVRQAFSLGDYPAYLPAVAASAPPPFKGVALTLGPDAPGDVALVDASWFYTWQPTYAHEAEVAAEFVPMAHGPTLSIPCPARLLVYNEPDLAGLSQAEAAGALWLIRQQCPATYTVFGNVSQEGLSWLIGALAEYEAQHGPYGGAVGVHWYGWQNADGLETFLQAAAGLPQGPVWLTEVGLFLAWDTPGEFGRALDLAAQYTERAAVFTSRPAGIWPERDYWLVNADGALTPAGQAVREF